MSKISLMSIDEIEKTATFNCEICEIDFTESIENLLYERLSDGSVNTNSIRLEHTCGTVIVMFNETESSINLLFTIKSGLVENVVPPLPEEAIPTAIQLKSPAEKVFVISVGDDGVIVTEEVVE